MWPGTSCPCSLWRCSIIVVAKSKNVGITASLYDAGRCSVQFHLLPLKELYYEGNRFVRCEPMSSVQDAEVLTLKVKCQHIHHPLCKISHSMYSVRLNWCICPLIILITSFPGTGCQICLAGGQEQVLSGPQDAPPLPIHDCPAGQWQLLCALPAALPHHLAGVCAFYQSEEGVKRFPQRLKQCDH